MGYWEKISNSLIENAVLTPADIAKIKSGKASASDLWEPVAVYYGDSNCDLCGTFIVNQHWIRNRRSGKHLVVGSKCIHNYLHADLAEALVRVANRRVKAVQNAQNFGKQLNFVAVYRELSKKAYLNEASDEERELLKAIRGVFLAVDWLFLPHPVNVEKRARKGYSLTRKERASLNLAIHLAENGITKETLVNLNRLLIAFSQIATGKYPWYYRYRGFPKEAVERFAPKLKRGRRKRRK